MFVVAKYAKAAADHFENAASMALNPPLLPGSTLPLPVNGETFVLQRKGIQLDADILVCLFSRFSRLHGGAYFVPLLQIPMHSQGSVFLVALHL